MAEHTPTPWRLRTTGNMGNLIEADSGKRMDHLDDGYRTVGSYQECCASDQYLEQQRNRDANGAFIVKAVNNHDALVHRLTQVKADLRKCATALPHEDELRSILEMYVEEVSATLTGAVGGPSK